MSMNLWEVFVDTMVLKNGISADGEGQGADGLLKALDTTSEERIYDEECKKTLKWCGEWLRNYLWRPMWVERSREMASMVENDDIS